MPLDGAALACEVNVSMYHVHSCVPTGPKAARRMHPSGKHHEMQDNGLSLWQLVEGGQAAHGTNNRPGGSWVQPSQRVTISTPWERRLGLRMHWHTTGGAGGSWWWSGAWSGARPDVLATPALLKQGCGFSRHNSSGLPPCPCASSAKTGPAVTDFTYD